MSLASQMPNFSIERTTTGKPVSTAHVKRSPATPLSGGCGYRCFLTILGTLFRNCRVPQPRTGIQILHSLIWSKPFFRSLRHPSGGLFTGPLTSCLPERVFPFVKKNGSPTTGDQGISLILRISWQKRGLNLCHFTCQGGCAGMKELSKLKCVLERTCAGVFSKDGIMIFLLSTRTTATSHQETHRRSPLPCTPILLIFYSCEAFSRGFDV